VSGICGVAFSDTDRIVEAPLLAHMASALGQSEQFTTTQVGSVGLGANSFHGYVTGLGRMTLNERPFAVSVHGRIYDEQELFSAGPGRQNLFENLLRLYAKEGTDFLLRLRGEYSLALWDGIEQALYLATDRFRVQPLFYYHDAEKFIFASQIRAILAYPSALDRSLDFSSVVDIVGSSIIPTPKTIYQKVKKLPPGYLLRYRKGEIHFQPYWDVDFRQSAAVNEQDLGRELKSRFRDAILAPLKFDKDSGQIGTFLSGGVDSSTLTGVLTQMGQRPIKSFSIGFAEERFNEINYARIAARAFGVEHHEYFVTPLDTFNAISSLTETFDEPFANASAIPTYYCAKLAKEHGVSVLYAGDGGDELFAGNERYADQRLFDYYQIIPGWLRNACLEPIIFGLTKGIDWNVLTKGKKYIQRANIPYPERLSSYGFYRTVPIEELLEASIIDQIGRDYDPYGTLNHYYNSAPASTELDRQLYLDLKLAISDNDLFKVTRMTSAANVAVCFPFLDHRLAEFAATIPAKIKMRGRKLRSFFKSVYSDLLPPETLAKTKHGFGLPIPIWLRTDRQLNDMMYDLLLSPRSVQRGYFRKSAIDDLVVRHKTDSTSFYGTVIWNLMVLELWHRRYLDSNAFGAGDGFDCANHPSALPPS